MSGQNTIEGKVEQLYKDVYFGNGKRPLMERMSTNEHSIDAIIYWGKWLLGTATALLIAVVADLIVHH